MIDDIDELLNGLYRKVVNGSGDSEISYQRSRNYRAYYMEPLESDTDADDNGTYDDNDGVNKDGRSDFVTSDVFDTVEDTKACMEETFASHRNTIRFQRQGDEDEVAVEYANQYVKRCFWEKNDGARFIGNSVHDGCLAKIAVAKVHWVESDEAEELPVGPMQPEQVLAMLSDPRVEPAEDFEEVEGPEGTYYQGSLTVTKDTSQQVLELVAPENFFPDEDATGQDDFLTAQDRVSRTYDELRDMGATDDQIDALSPYTGQDSSFNEDLARKQNDNTQAAFFKTEVAVDGQDEVWVYNAHFIADIDGNGPRPWYMQYCGTLLLNGEEAIDRDDLTIKEAIDQRFITPLKRMPYRVWSPYPLSHRWNGMAVADPVYAIQSMRTKMQRSISDYMARTNNARLQGDSENIRNFNEFIENPIGGFADLEDPTIPITPIAQPQMSPLVFQTLEMITQERDERVPVSRLSSGRNQDVITNQNAASMIEKMASRGDKRMAKMARNYAEFLKALLIDLYTVGVENDDKPVSLNVDGEWQQVIPKQLPKLGVMSVSVALTPQEANQEASRLLQLHQTYLMDPVLSEMYLPKDRYRLMGEVAELLDKQDAFLSGPDSQEYMQAQQQKQQGMQMQSQQAMQQQQMMFQMQAQFTAQMEQFKAEQRKWEKMLDAKLKDEQMDLNAAQGAERLDLDRQGHALDEAKFDHQQIVDAAELTLEAEQKRPVAI